MTNARAALNAQITLPEDLPSARTRLLTRFSPALAEVAGYTVTADSGASITWTRRVTPLFLAAQYEHVLVASLSETDGVTTVTFNGFGPDRLHELFTALEEGARS